MKILLQCRSNLFQKLGGDTSQAVQLADWLRQSGHTATVEICQEARLQGYHIVHIFGIMRADEAFAQWRNAAGQGIPTVLTPCFQDLTLYNKKGRFGLSRLACRMVGYRPDRIAYVRSLWLSSVMPSTRKNLKIQRLMGMERQMGEVLAGVNGILFSSQAERAAVYQRFGACSGVLNSLIPNGIAPFHTATSDLFQKQFGIKDYILCAGRIEDLKNQLALIGALTGRHTPIVLAGEFNKAHRAYGRAIRTSLRKNKNLHYVGFLQRDMLGSCYRGARVHVQPSWFENVGLSTLEALSCGVPCVMTASGYGGDYFGDNVEYCDPSSRDSIRDAVTMAMEKGGERTQDLQELASSYDWQRVGPRYIEFYEKVLAR